MICWSFLSPPIFTVTINCTETGELILDDGAKQEEFSAKQEEFSNNKVPQSVKRDVCGGAIVQLKPATVSIPPAVIEINPNCRSRSPQPPLEVGKDSVCTSVDLTSVREKINKNKGNKEKLPKLDLKPLGRRCIARTTLANPTTRSEKCSLTPDLQPSIEVKPSSPSKLSDRVPTAEVTTKKKSTNNRRNNKNAVGIPSKLNSSKSQSTPQWLSTDICIEEPEARSGSQNVEKAEKVCCESKKPVDSSARLTKTRFLWWNKCKNPAEASQETDPDMLELGLCYPMERAEAINCRGNELHQGGPPTKRPVTKQSKTIGSHQTAIQKELSVVLNRHVQVGYAAILIGILLNVPWIVVLIVVHNNIAYNRQ